MLQQKETVVPDHALLAIESAAPHLSQTYLEATLEAGITSPEEFHPKLAQMYLADLKAKEQQQRQPLRAIAPPIRVPPPVTGTRPATL